MGNETPIGYVVSVGQGTGYRPTFLAASTEYETTSAWTHARIFDRLVDAESEVKKRGAAARIWAILKHKDGRRYLTRPLST